MAAPGGLETLSLAEGESVRVNPRHIVAWDSGLEIEGPSVALEPRETVALEKKEPMVEDWQERALSAAKKSLDWTGRKTQEISEAALRSMKERVLGSVDLYTVKGPGLLVLSRRRQPSWFRSAAEASPKESLK